MLSDEQIKQKWTECTRSHRRGDVISSVDMATELARWVEQQALEQALRENERLTKQIRNMKPVVQAAHEVWRTRANAEMSGSLEDAASLSEAEGVLFDALAALKELDDD